MDKPVPLTAPVFLGRQTGLHPNASFTDYKTEDSTWCVVRDSGKTGARSQRIFLGARQYVFSSTNGKTKAQTPEMHEYLELPRSRLVSGMVSRRASRPQSNHQPRQESCLLSGKPSLTGLQPL